jgi:nitrilase
MSELKVGLAQISPVWLNKKDTLAKTMDYVSMAATEDCHIVGFGEGIVPGYPFWVMLTDGAKFNDTTQKEMYAHYVKEAVSIEDGDLEAICALAADLKIAVYLGIIEKAGNRGQHSVYASIVYIDQSGHIQSVHRKLQPTYEERLVWAQGDGNGLQVHSLNEFTVGGLNCWENWMPLTRTALTAQGENLHFAIWPGSPRLTQDITRFMALEGRSFVASVSGVMHKSDIPENIPHYDRIMAAAPAVLADGGSCLAGPDGQWLIEPADADEQLLTATIDFDRVLEERHNFDVAGHYSRPDVTKLEVNRDRQAIATFSGNRS